MTEEGEAEMGGDATYGEESPTPVEELDQGPVPGALICAECGYAISLEAAETGLVCPGCGGSEFRRAPMFERTTLSVDVIEVDDDEPSWLQGARSRKPGRE